MKKNLLLFAAFIALSASINAQSPKLISETQVANPFVRQLNASASESSESKLATSTVHDTLHYFFSKHYYRNPNTPTTNPPNLNFLTIKSPYPGANVGYCGAVFLNSSSVNVHGLEGLVIKNQGSVSNSVGVKLYLCNVNGANLPIMPPLDSVLTSVSAATAGVWAGGTFTAPVTVTGNFAVLFNIGSNIAGDTIRLFLNNAFTATSTALSSQKYGEGLGIIRFNGNYQLTTGVFGGAAGNDYEFIVAPYVSYNITAAATAATPTICNLSMGSFNNLSTPMNLIENRQFNFNKFKPYWTPTNTLIPTTDSIYNWAFSGTSTGTSTAKNPTAYFNVLGNQTAALTVKQRYSTVGLGNSFASDVAMTTVSVTNATSPSVTVSGITAFCTNSAVVTTTLFCTGNPTYTWSAPINSVSAIVVITQTAATAIYTVLAQNGGCTAVKTVTITKRSIPNVSLTVTNATLCTSSTGGSSITLTGLPAGGVYSGTGVSGSSFVPPNAAGNYTTVYSYTNVSSGCTNSASTVMNVANCTGITNMEEAGVLNVFPNPSLQGKFMLKSSESLASIEIYNLLGVLIYHKSVNDFATEVDLSEKPSGNYILKVTHFDGGTKTLKIVNQNY
jgi:hypothetical protein